MFVDSRLCEWMSIAHNITRVTRGLYMLNFISGGGMIQSKIAFLSWSIRGYQTVMGGSCTSCRRGQTSGSGLPHWHIQRYWVAVIQWALDFYMNMNESLCDAVDSAVWWRCDRTTAVDSACSACRIMCLFCWALFKWWQRRCVLIGCPVWEWQLSPFLPVICTSWPHLLSK